MSQQQRRPSLLVSSISVALSHDPFHDQVVRGSSPRTDAGREARYQNICADIQRTLTSGIPLPKPKLLRENNEKISLSCQYRLLVLSPATLSNASLETTIRFAVTI